MKLCVGFFMVCVMAAQTYIPGWVNVSNDQNLPHWKYADASGEYVGSVYLSPNEYSMWFAYVGESRCRSGQFATVEAAKKCVTDTLESAKEKAR